MFPTKSNPTNTPAVSVGTSLTTLVELGLSSIGGKTFVQFINNGATGVNRFADAGFDRWRELLQIRRRSRLGQLHFRALPSSRTGSRASQRRPLAHLGPLGKPGWCLICRASRTFNSQPQVGSGTTSISTLYSGQSQRR